jgi:hypothetical protein
MNPTLSRGLVVAGLVALVTPAAASFAQTAPGAPPATAAKPRHDPAERAARHAERLRAALQLRPDQEGALHAFVDALKPAAGARETWKRDRGEMANLSTPQRLERERARMAQRQARFDQRAAATLRFYGQLSPAQQKAFDALAPSGHDRGEHRGQGRHGGMDG